VIPVLEVRVNEGQAPASAEALFGALWCELVGLLGTTAAATLLSRSVTRAAAAIPELAAVRITREALAYAYAVPASWRDPRNAAAVVALRRMFAEELEPLLRELTGGVVRRHLSRVPELAALSAPPEEEHHER
jgi:hypothetical protein